MISHLVGRSILGGLARAILGVTFLWAASGTLPAAGIFDGFSLTGTAIEPLPEILIQPTSVGAVAGTRVVFNVSATGTAGGSALTYQWFFNGKAISDSAARNASYAVKVSSARAGSYRVAVTNAAGTVSSETATLSLHFKPTATIQPRVQTVDDESPLLLTATASGTPAPTFQWLLDGEEIPGATASTFQIESVDVFDAGAYTVRVGNVAGSSVSKPASVLVRGAPQIANELEDSEVAVGTTVRLQVLAFGYPKLRYQWRFNGVPIRGDAARRAVYSFKAALDRAGVYDVVVTNSLGSVTSNAAEVIVTQAPKIGKVPASAKLRAGRPHTLGVTATGFPTPTYQWFKDGAPLPGQTGPNLSFASLALGDSGRYSVVVQNPFGSVTKEAVLDVTYAPHALNSRSRISITGDGYLINGEYLDLAQTLRFSGGKIREGGDSYAYAYKRQSATQSTIKLTQKVEGVKVTLTYVFSFSGPDGGTCHITATAPGYDELLNGSGPFTYSE